MLGLALAVVLAGPALAQFSDSYNFLKAVKDKDVAKVNEYADKPGTTVVNTRDADTGEAAIHMVTRRGDLGWVGLIVQKGGNINLKDGQGNTPLILATIARWAEGVGLYVRLKAQVNAQNRLGETALLKAVQNRDSIIAKALLDAGANPDLADNSGVTARSAAEADPRAAAIARLLKDVPVRQNKAVQGPQL
jgi:ankyrin repeat protein